MTRIHAKRNRLLIVDGRSRWETRYLKNLFTRDPAWEVTTCVAAPNADVAGLPTEEPDLFDFNLVIFGDVNEMRLTDEFTNALPRFASQRGGGIIFLDGQREYLRQTNSRALQQMLPVRWEQWSSSLPSQIEPASESNLPEIFERNSSKSPLPFGELVEVNYVASVRARLNASTVLVAKNSVATTPALVTQQYGAGRIAYLATDQTWRWRRKQFARNPNGGSTRTDQHHSAFWNQLASWTMAQPYNQSNEFVALDTGKVAYTPGESIPIRCLLKQPPTDADAPTIDSRIVVATIRSRNGNVRRVPLKPHPSIPGQYESTVESLPKSSYTVKIEVDGYPASALALEDSFQVVSASSAERRDSRCNEAELSRLSEASGGQFLHESEVAALVPLLRPRSNMVITQDHFAVWETLGWFSIAIALLATEWWMRKRYGLI